MNWGFLRFFVEEFGMPAVVAISAFLLAKVFSVLYQRSENVRTLRQKELENLIKLFSDGFDDKHRFLLEQVIENKYRVPISWRELQYILNLHSPSEAIKAYINGRQFLTHPLNEERPRYKRASYSKQWVRALRKGWNMLFYYVFFVLAFILILLSVFLLQEKTPSDLLGPLTLSAYCFFTAWLCASGHLAMESAEKFLKISEHSELHAKKGSKQWYY